MQPLREDGLQLVNFDPEPTLVQEFCCRSCWIIWCSLYQPLKDQEHNNLTRNNSYLLRGCKTPWSRWKASTACWPSNPPQGWPPKSSWGSRSKPVSTRSPNTGMKSTNESARPKDWWTKEELRQAHLLPSIHSKWACLFWVLYYCDSKGNIWAWSQPFFGSSSFWSCISACWTSSLR